jgi:cation diffusion facilitator CzcD-associated flavoprotein CzcO
VQSSTARRVPKESKIVIVGAGPSGIAAASKLLQGGVNDFVILEANDRIGGRIYTKDFGK